MLYPVFQLPFLSPRDLCEWSEEDVEEQVQSIRGVQGQLEILLFLSL